MAWRHVQTAVISAFAVAAILVTALVAIAFATGKGASPRVPAVTGRIKLRRDLVHGGQTVRGEVIFANHSPRTKVLLRSCKIDGLFAIGFRASDGYVQEPAFSLVGCSPEQEMVAHPGTTIYRFTTNASYVVCSGSTNDQPPRSSKYWTPLCLKDSRGKRDMMPPLPAGKYTAVFFSDGVWHGPRVMSAGLVVTTTK